MDEDIKKIFEGMELSDDFKKKFKEVYEASVKEIKEKAEEEAEEKYNKLSEEYSEYVVTEMEGKLDEYIKEELIPSVDRYMNHVTESFMEDNKLVIESETKVALADEFLKGFSQIAESYNVVLPEDKKDAFAELQGKLDEANKTIEKLVEKSEKLDEQIKENEKSKIVSEVTGDMTETQKEKFVESCSRVKYIDDKQFKSAITELKESYSPSKEDDKKLNEKQDEPTKETVTESDKWLDSLFSKI